MKRAAAVRLVRRFVCFVDQTRIPAFGGWVVVADPRVVPDGAGAVVIGADTGSPLRVLPLRFAVNAAAMGVGLFAAAVAVGAAAVCPECGVGVG